MNAHDALCVPSKDSTWMGINWVTWRSSALCIAVRLSKSLQGYKLCWHGMSFHMIGGQSTCSVLPFVKFSNIQWGIQHPRVEHIPNVKTSVSYRVFQLCCLTLTLCYSCRNSSQYMAKKKKSLWNDRFAWKSMRSTQTLVWKYNRNQKSNFVFAYCWVATKHNCMALTCLCHPWWLAAN